MLDTHCSLHIPQSEGWAHAVPAMWVWNGALTEDEFAAKHDMIRVVDESGEDYLYPSSYFVRVELPQAVEQTLRKIA